MIPIKNKANAAALIKLRQERKAFINNIKTQNPCTDCKLYFPADCMDFDHLEPSAKEANIGKLILGSFDTLQAEISKCELVCANCHRVRTTKRKLKVPLTERLAYDKAVRNKHELQIKEERLLTRKQVMEMVGYSKAHIDRLEKTGMFPRHFNPEGRPNGKAFWSFIEIQEYIARLKTLRDERI